MAVSAPRKPFATIYDGATDRFVRKFGSRPKGGSAPVDPKAKVVKALMPNVGLQVAYERKLLALARDMHASVTYWIKAKYRAAEPATIARDEPAWRILTRAMKGLADRWIGKFDEMADQLAIHFARSVADRTDADLRRILTDGGMMLPQWKMTAAPRDALMGIVQTNVSLIKSIPREYLAQVERDVMLSVANGRDLSSLADDLEAHYGVTKRKAQQIALSQNQMATAALRKVRFVESGIEQAVWMHSSAGKTPRPTHLAAGRAGVVFDVAKGWYDPHEERFIQPGELIGCRCSCRPVIPGLAIGKPKRGWAA